MLCETRTAAGMDGELESKPSAMPWPPLMGEGWCLRVAFEFGPRAASPSVTLSRD